MRNIELNLQYRSNKARFFPVETHAAWYFKRISHTKHFYWRMISGCYEYFNVNLPGHSTLGSLTTSNGKHGQMKLMQQELREGRECSRTYVTVWKLKIQCKSWYSKIWSHIGALLSSWGEKRLIPIDSSRTKFSITRLISKGAFKPASNKSPKRNKCWMVSAGSCCTTQSVWREKQSLHTSFK